MENKNVQIMVQQYLIAEIYNALTLLTHNQMMIVRKIFLIVYLMVKFV